MGNYLDNLKKTDLRPKKIKIGEGKEEILLEKDVHSGIVKELFVKTSEIEAMPSGPRKDIAILRLSMIAELDAANLYERFAELASNDTVRKTLLDVAYEEKVHVGEFESLLEDMDPSYEKAEKEGEEEVEELL